MHILNVLSMNYLYSYVHEVFFYFTLHSLQKRVKKVVKLECWCWINIFIFCILFQVVSANPAAVSGSTFQPPPPPTGPPPPILDSFAPPAPAALVESYPPPPPPPHYYPSYGPAPPPSCYTHSPPTRTIPYISRYLLK